MIGVVNDGSAVLSEVTLGLLVYCCCCFLLMVLSLMRVLVRDDMSLNVLLLSYNLLLMLLSYTLLIIYWL